MPETVRDARDKCARCGHVWTFHQKREGALCKAVGCHVKGKTGERCEGFLDLQVVSEGIPWTSTRAGLPRATG